MKDLKNLRHLYIGGCNKLTYMPKGMANLTCLHTLSMYVVGSATCSGNIGELRHLNIRGELALCGLNNVKTAADAKEASLCTKRELLSLDLSWSCEQNMENVEEVVEFLQPHQNIKWLRIKEYEGTNFPNWMMRCEVHLPNLVEVVLLNCSRCEHLPPLGQLRFLEVLSIEGLAGVKYLGHSQSNFYGSQGGNATELFHSLKVFRLIKMANLEEWVGMEVTGASTFFPRLTSLLICDCPKLRTVPHLPSIQVLQISVCPLLLPKKGFFMKMNFLNVLDISECNKLTLMLTEEEVSGSSTFLGHLEYLAMRSCKELVSLSDEFMCHLSSLKILAIDHCKNLVGSSSSCSSSIEGRGLQLQHITTIERLRIRWCDKVVGNPLKLPGPCLRELTLFNCLNLQSLSLSGLNVLQFLSIRSCQNLASFPDGLGHLAALEELEIIDCPGLTTLPEWLGCLTNLRRLDVGSQTLVSLPQSLGYLPALRNLVFRYVTWTCLPDWIGGLTTLVELKVSGCSSLTSLPEGLGRLTQLEVLYIDDCPRLTSLPKDLQPQLPRLKWLIIVSSPKLARQCTPGGKYWHLISQIPSRAINLRSNTIENSWKYCTVWTEPQQHRSLQLLL